MKPWWSVYTDLGFRCGRGLRWYVTLVWNLLLCRVFCSSKEVEQATQEASTLCLLSRGVLLCSRGGIWPSLCQYWNREFVTINYLIIIIFLQEDLVPGEATAPRPSSCIFFISLMIPSLWVIHWLARPSVSRRTDCTCAPSPPLVSAICSIPSKKYVYVCHKSWYWSL